MRAVAYLRVSDTSQIEGHSLEAQERAFYDFCKNREWEPVAVYREEGKSAKHDKIAKRPVFQWLLQDAEAHRFDVVVVHTLDRWARNQNVLTETLSFLGNQGIGIASVTENIDYSTPQGRLFTQMLGSFAEYYSGALATHVKKGVSERARKGLHLGGIPFGYDPCQPTQSEDRQPCEPEHPGGVHLIEEEAEAVVSLFKTYATGTTTLARLAAGLNQKGLRTKQGRYFTTSSVRGILHQPFYTGKVRHRNELHDGVHESLISQRIFTTVQATLKKNSGRSFNTKGGSHREYLLRGLVRCAHCGLPLWAQTLYSGNAFYREETQSRSTTEKCPAEGKTIKCHIPDGQMGKIIGALVLPDAWLDRVLARIQLEDEVTRIEQERQSAQEKLRRLAKAYVDGLYADEDYRREKQSLEERISSLVVPGVDAAQEAGKLLEDLPRLWTGATLSERRTLLTTMLDAVYIDLIDDQAIVAIKPKPAFRPLFDIVNTREGSGVTFIENAETGADSASACLRWRRGGVDLPRKHDLEVILVAS